MLYIKEIVRYLGSCRPYVEVEEPSERRKKAEALERRLRNVAIGFGIPVPILALLHWAKLLPPAVALLAQLLGLACILFWAASALIFPVSMLRRVKSWNDDLTDYDVEVEGYMMSLAKPLCACTTEQLKYIDARLAERYESISGRMSMVFGEGVVKAGVLAVLLDAIDKLGKIPDQVNKIGFQVRPGFLITLGVYFFLFFIVVPFCLKLFASRYPFQRRIVKIALDLKAIGNIEDDGNFHPPSIPVSTYSEPRKTQGKVVLDVDGVVSEEISG
ncbi:MAG TPA: hypothetical protein VME63_16315 [Dyella sp.]|uniref:hypothetical protein n=1 Tax=Dyella sp. TaxID=1869338 RepID=UPI002B7F06BB|nr:hypothetical protein [Dyella sp.]HTV86965.1 hypothetical protein [Dyella sp.]